MAKKKKCVIQIKNKDDLCLARAIVTMKERADEGSITIIWDKENPFKNGGRISCIKKHMFPKATETLQNLVLKAVPKPSVMARKYLVPHHPLYVKLDEINYEEERNKLLRE